ncbi:hypothetical protein VaNZ11_008552 [Volvox africanus]|uniref:Uncharacterized protein n=1 Tax=Volvox africanus TaxID=51714 RepID=A0ABQ5S6R3_9CHLO|nr:hypothetical protein VaNZ11_008552 [Volvox africanus]
MSSLVSSLLLFLLLRRGSCFLEMEAIENGNKLPKDPLSGLGRHALNQVLQSRSVRELLSTTSQQTCIWQPPKRSIASNGICGVNEYFILTMRGAPPSTSARILAYTFYKLHVCSSYSSEPDCVANSSHACTWDGGAYAGGAGDSGHCHLSMSAVFDPEVLRGRLYCEGSLLDAAARCALAAPGPTSCASASASLAASGAAKGGVSGGCIFANASQLANLTNVARRYLRLASLVSYTSPDLEGPAGVGDGLCVAGWLWQQSTLASLQSTLANDPAYGLLQRDLRGHCDGTDWLAKALAGATAICTAAGSSASVADSQRDSCLAIQGCSWDDGSSTCEAGYEMLVDALYDMNDAWIRALSNMLNQCNAASSSFACSAAATAMDVDPTLMPQLANVLTDQSWVMPGSRKGQGSSAPRAGGAVTSWLLLLVSTLTAVLLGRGGGGLHGGGVDSS